MMNKIIPADGKPYFEMRCACSSTGRISVEVNFPKAIEKESFEDQAAIREALAADAVVRLSRRLSLNIDEFIVRLRAVDEVFRKHYENPANN